VAPQPREADVTRKLVLLAKPPKPVSQMTDAELDAFAAEIVESLRHSIETEDRPVDDADHRPADE
jgi:hypothetical protein